MELIFTPYGRAAMAELTSAVAAAKGGDPLAPVTVIVPHNYAGVSVRRALGQSVVAGDRPGVAAVQFLTAYRLAELLGGPVLAAAGRRPVSTAVLAATVRGVLTHEPGVFAAVRDHPATERALVTAHRELSELRPGALDRLAQEGTRAADVVRIHRAIWGRLHQRWYVETDLAGAASGAIASNPALASDLGPVIWHLPQVLPPSMGRLGTTLAATARCTVIVGLTGEPVADAPVMTTLRRLGIEVDDSTVAFASITSPLVPPITVTSGSDADEEVRVVVRGVVNAARRGVALDAMAVLHPGREPYARLLHEQLAAADIAINGTTPRTLAESVVGRTLVALLDLPDHDFRRTDVMAVLASSPLRWRGSLAPASAWERNSRAAGVVGTPAQWRDRLARHAGDLRARVEHEAAGEHSDWLVERLEREAARSDSLAEFVAQLARDLARGHGEAGWRERSEWAAGLVHQYLGDPGDDWPAIEHAAANKVQAALDRLAGLEAVEPSPSPAVFRRTLVHELEASLGRLGRLGSGVLIATPADALGVDLEHVFLVGLAEGTFPGRVRDDSLLPDRERAAAGRDLPRRSDRPHDDQRQLLAVLAAADNASITWPRGDLRRNAERMPSRWLVDLVEQAAGPVRGPGLEGVDVEWVSDVPSHVGGLLGSRFPSSEHEYDLRALLDNEREGGRVDAHPIAGERPIVSRGLELVRARRGAQLTRFDGNIGTRPDLDPANEGQVLSATRLETWVQCPFQYLMQYVLRVQPIDDVDELIEISPLDRGSLVHEVLDEFLTEAITRPADEHPRPDDAWGPADHDRIVTIAERHLMALEARGLTGRAVFWRTSRRAIVRELREFLRRDDEYRASMRAQPQAAELGFGLARTQAPTLQWPLPDGRVLRFRGSADRVDRLADGGIAVLDYKTGSPRKYKGVSADDPDRRGSVLQLPIYAQAARRVLEQPDASVYAAYWFVSARGRFEQLGYHVTREVVHRFDDVFTTVADGITAGMFVSHPDEPRSFTLYVTCPFCDPDGLGTRHRWLEWERKRHAPEVAGYLALVDPDLVASAEVAG